jgi:hypothetical protein
MFVFTPVVFNHDPSKQELYDACVSFLSRQQRQCAVILGNGEKSCRYRHADMACIVGCLIGDEYRPEMECRDILHVIEHFGTLPFWFTEHRFLLSDLQAAHDSVHVDSAADLRCELERVAELWGLNDDVLGLLTEFKCD